MAVTARDQLIAVANLKQIWSAYWQRVKNSSAGIDGITPHHFHENLTQYIHLIRSEVKEGYNFSSLRAVPVPKKDPSKFRVICIPTIQDRLVQRALIKVMESKAQKLGIANDVSFGFVKDTETSKRGASAARAAAIKHRNQKPWAFKTDIQAFFDQIDRHKLIEQLSSAFRLSSLRPLMFSAIKCEVDDSNPLIRRVLRDNGIYRGRGLRQGMPISPILSNFVLRNFDKAFTVAGYDMVRYADDLVVMASTRAECEEIKKLAISELKKLDLKISEPKTEICSPEQPIEFLGMELGLNPNSKTYRLTISDQQMAKIKGSFTDFHDIDFALKEKLNLPKLLLRLENMKSGYRAAYGVADNFPLFSKSLDAWSNNCITKVYGSVFGHSKISSLTARHREFLLLPPSSSTVARA